MFVILKGILCIIGAFVVAREIIESLKPRLPPGAQLLDTSDSWRGPNPLKTFLELTEIKVIWRNNLAYTGNKKSDVDRVGKDI